MPSQWNKQEWIEIGSIHHIYDEGFGGFADVRVTSIRFRKDRHENEVIVSVALVQNDDSKSSEFCINEFYEAKRKAEIMRGLSDNIGGDAHQEVLKIIEWYGLESIQESLIFNLKNKGVCNACKEEDAVQVIFGEGRVRCYGCFKVIHPEFNPDPRERIGNTKAKPYSVMTGPVEEIETIEFEDEEGE